MTMNALIAVTATAGSAGADHLDKSGDLVQCAVPQLDTIPADRQQRRTDAVELCAQPVVEPMTGRAGVRAPTPRPAPDQAALALAAVPA